MLNAGDSFLGVEYVVGQEAEVYEGSFVTIAFGNDGSGGAIFDDGDLKPSFKEFAQVSFRAEVGRHAGEYDPVDAALSELQQQIVVFRAIDLVRAGER